VKENKKQEGGSIEDDTEDYSENDEDFTDEESEDEENEGLADFDLQEEYKMVTVANPPRPPFFFFFFLKENFKLKQRHFLTKI